ncbi:RNA 2',3'-cyclic phosphodiesterase [Paenibacillus mesophilus]|uniref:RNA 2',3'-cyclic phosphodiesterase n=1 Tax=Paenibacillus mesophilus TaxID=2582849 RepID=UPI00110F1797|nr:RNA 2',3'-cyclic phosphodiesterase [Paenibacillus mesophilus]TMV45405.1 RNA 2',3'-cyclic phosphodiesterase [Paenibacillus mesophilus]
MTQPTTSEQPRLFVAVPIPAELKAKAGATVNGLKRQLPFKKWVHPDDLHITLKFIGEVAPSAVPAIETALARIAARSNPFALQLSGAGTFGAPQAPRVLWAGLGGKLQPLKSLQADVESELAGLGYEPENRPYSPHITLARQYSGTEPARKDALAGLFRPEEDTPLEWTADRLVLYRSHFGRTPMYEPIRTIVFHAGG